MGGMRYAWLPGLFVLWQVPAIDWQRPFVPAGQTLVREHVFFEVGHQLGLTLPSTAVVAAPDSWAACLDAEAREMLPEPGKAEIDPVELKHRPAPRLLDEQFHVAFHGRVPAIGVHVQVMVDPAFLEEYHLERAYPADVWMSKELLVFRRTAGAN